MKNDKQKSQNQPVYKLTVLLQQNKKCEFIFDDRDICDAHKIQLQATNRIGMYGIKQISYSESL